jgi:hypothetical protein
MKGKLMDDTYTHLTLVVDHSGSMSSVKNDAEGGIKELLETQYAEPGKLTVTLVEFDTQINEVARLAKKEFEYKLVPAGSTALLDAVGQEIVKTGLDLEKLPESKRPSQVLFVIVTDGEENSSHEYTLEKVKEMISHQKDAYKWTFQFIGAEEAAWQGEALGVASTSYDGSAVGMRSAYMSTNASISNFRNNRDEAFAMPDVIANIDDTSPIQKAPKKTTTKSVAPIKKVPAVKAVKAVKKATTI